jgi:hypothetical protein
MHPSKIKKKLDFTMEIANGCRHSCNGCTVDKDNNHYPTDNEFERIQNLIDDLESSDVEMLNFILGPTDILTSSNKEEILDDPRIHRIASKFLKVTLNCTFLDPDPTLYQWLAKKVETLIPYGLLKFTVPFEVRHIDNPTYIERIRGTIAYFESLLTTVKITRIYSIVNFEEAIANDYIRGFTMTQDIVRRAFSIDLHPTSHTDFLLPHGRESLRDPHNQERFLVSIHHLNNLLIEAYDESRLVDETFGIVELDVAEGEDWDLVYRNSELYLPPFVVEAFTSFEPEFAIQGPWTFNNIFQQDQEGILEAVALAASNGICRGCEFVGKCAERGMQQVIDITQSDKCISAAPHRRHVFQWNREDEQAFVENQPRNLPQADQVV